MCGCAGILSLRDRPLEQPERARTMAARLVHRGPDEAGEFVNQSGTIALAHRRLRIIDLETGQQPLSNEDGTVTVVFNGEIYGFQALRKMLEEQGHRFRTHTDTEVIVHLYEDHGSDCLRQLKGMFAFALWDERTQRLFLARDRLGKKPLYYATHEGTFLFASELDALLAMPGLGGEIDELALDQYLTLGYIPAPRTIYQHIKKLEAGHYLLVKSGELQKERYWIPFSPAPESMDWNEAKQELVRRLRAATAVRMVSDVPIGCFLSGGVDSSTVLAFMAELSAQPVKTFSIGFPEAEYSELAHARTIARHLGTDHHEYVLEPGDVDVLDELVRHFGEPFADPSALPTWYLAEMTRKSVTVALTGDGGDELFGGYGWYQTGRLLEAASFVPRWIAGVGVELASVPGLRVLRRMGKAAALLAHSPGERYAAQRQVVCPGLKVELYTPEFRARAGRAGLEWLAEQYDQIKVEDPLNRMMAADLVTYMAEDLLVKVDRTSMAHALECRSPLLDIDLVEWVLSLPSSYKLSSRGNKWLLREAMGNRFPPGFLDRRKQGFDVPLARWFRGNLHSIVEERVLHGPLDKLGAFESRGLDRVVNEHLTGRANHEATVWALLVLASWTQRYAA